MNVVLVRLMVWGMGLGGVAVVLLVVWALGGFA